MTIDVKPRAMRQLLAANKWWKRHRGKAPDALQEDFAATLSLIAGAPRTGKFVKAQREGIVRRYLMERVRYYVFCRIKPDGDIDILQLWHASRRPPKR